MAKGYAEGPAAEEAERRRDELAAGVHDEVAATRLAVYGATADDASRHFLGWVGEVDPDELFATGAAWGITIVRRPLLVEAAARSLSAGADGRLARGYSV